MVLPSFEGGMDSLQLITCHIVAPHFRYEAKKENQAKEAV